MNDLETKRGIEKSLKSFADKPIVDAATTLFESLGYKSQKHIVLQPNTAKTFIETFTKDKPLNTGQALLADWQSVDFLFQLTDEEIRAAAQGSQQFLFESKGEWNGAMIESYLFFAIALAKPSYTRTELSGITRAVNRLFPMPAMLLFRHGDTLTLAVINRRLHKRDESRDVLEKVTLIKDIRFASPHRAHVEILADLSFDALRERHDFANFVALHAAWQKSLDSSELNKRFFLEVANWYFWALDHVEFPKDAPKENGEDHISVIRLITRLMFVWFIKEKGLVPDLLFDERKLPQILNGFSPIRTSDKESVFYRAILQNLFFATLNTEMDKRGWTKEEQNFMAHSLYRFRELFQKPAEALDMFKNIPFLNGGLFECLDKDMGETAKPRYVRIDGFSRREDSQAIVPDFLFFGQEREVDLSADYGDNKFKKVKVRGLINTLNYYKFTVAENTPIEEEIALDPELSGKVFENLLAAYNPETGATARKQTGSFYTPREIVNYMVEEALIACLKTKLEAASPSAKEVEARLRNLVAYNHAPHQFNAMEVDGLIGAIDGLKTLDPAVGSGAFPMGILHKLVFILGKLDPRNEKWKERQISRVRDAMVAAQRIEDPSVRERAVSELQQQISGINEAFEQNELDYGRKLYLIENCIYGVDIQPIAVQIAKMRFFISLIVDQKIDDSQPNRGVRPLPNLETKFVAANSLIPLEKQETQFELGRDSAETIREIESHKTALAGVRHEHFIARNLRSKAKCRDEDARLRSAIADLLSNGGYSQQQAKKLARWDPYDQNATADFFDPEWMFGLRKKFDITIGNPPYVRVQNLPHEVIDVYKRIWTTAWKRIDVSTLFMELAMRVCERDGLGVFISSNQFLATEYGRKTREFFLKTAGFTKMLDLADLPVFENTITYVSIFFESPSPKAEFYYAKVKELPFDPARLSWETIRTANLSSDVWVLGANTQLRLVSKLTSENPRLAQYAKCWAGLFTGMDEVLLFEQKDERKDLVEKEILMPVLRAQSCDRYCYATPTKFTIYPYSEQDGRTVLIPEPELKREFPKAHAYLRKNKEALESRKDSRTTLGEKGAWYGLVRFGRRSVFTREKIVSPGEVRNNKFALDKTGSAFSCARVFAITAESAKLPLLHLLGLLNSKLIEFFLHKTAPLKQGGYYSYSASVLDAIPVKLPEKDQTVETLVQRVLAQKAKKPDADTTTLEREIDQEVYALYDLTMEEINIVEAAIG